MKAGALVAQGAYGCILSPAIPCASSKAVETIPGLKIRGTMGDDVTRLHEEPTRNKRNKSGPKTSSPSQEHPHTVSKVFDSKTEMKTEWTMAQRIARLDPSQKYFVYATDKCEVTRASVLRSQASNHASDHQSCDILMKNYKTDIFPSVRMPNGGIPMHRWLAKRKGTLDLVELVKLFLPVFNALQLLNKAGLVHQDMKANNILIDTGYASYKNPRARIIDFGLMTQASGLFDSKQNSMAFSPYWLLPPEYRVRRWIRNNHNHAKNKKLTDMDIQNLVIQETDHLNRKFSGTHDIEWLKSIYNMFWPSQCERETNIRRLADRILRAESAEAALKRYTARVDIYGLGLIMMWASQYTTVFLQHAHSGPGIANEPRIPEWSDFREIIRAMTSADPSKRATVKKAQGMVRAFVGKWGA